MEEKFKEEKALRESHSRVSSAGRGQEPKPPGKDPAKPSEDLLEALLAAAAARQQQTSLKAPPSGGSDHALEEEKT